MNTKKNIKYLLAAVAILFSACSDDFLKENPPHFTSADKLYTSVEGYESGINGLYSLMRQEREGYRFTSGFGAIGLRAIIHMAGTDNVAVNTRGDLSNIMSDWRRSNVSTDAGLRSLFAWLYSVVNASNTIINRAENADIDFDWGDDATKHRIIAEARTARAWAYRHLTYLWGNVPLILDEVSGDAVRADFTRDPVSEIREVIIEDLRYAQEHLPWLPAKAGRMTKGVALTYLSEMFLAVNEPDSALFYAEKCIDEGPYRLVENRYGAGSNRPGVAFMDMFNPENVNIESGNTEALWVMQWQRNVIGGGDNLMRHETVTRYQTSSNFLDNIIVPTEERGGRGWNRIAITPYAFKLYYQSSDSVAGLLDERGSEYAINKYFILCEADTISKDINPGTGRRWALGDTIWIAASSGGGRNFPYDKTESGAYNFNLLENRTINSNWPFSLKFAHCDPGYPLATETHLNQTYMRLAETILLKAEAHFRLNQPDLAADEMNKLRDRANAKRITAAEMSIDQILEERSRELILEEQRRYTLLRALGGREFFLRVTAHNTKDQNLQLRDTLFPIPQSVIDANIDLLMENNPGFFYEGPAAEEGA